MHFYIESTCPARHLTAGTMHAPLSRARADVPQYYRHMISVAAYH